MYEMIKEKYKNLNISEKDLKPYIFPSQRELNKNKIKTAYLGNYVPWDVRKQVEIIKEFFRKYTMWREFHKIIIMKKLNV